MEFKQSLAQRIIIAFALMSALVAGAFAIGIIATVHLVEEKLISAGLGGDHELRAEVLVLLRLAAEALDHIGIAQRQAHVRGGGAVGALEQRRAGLCHHHGKLHAALLVILGGRQQAGGAEGVERLAHLGNHAHAAVLEGRLVLVRGAVVRRKFFFSDGVRRVQRGGEGLAAVVGMARALRQRLGLQHFEQLEVEVAAVDEQGFGQGASGVLHCRI